MDPHDELITLETDGWCALSADGAAAIEFYGRLLDESAVMLLPGEAWRLVFHQGTPR